ncbi:MAG: VCBS repeat-containing protein [Verrucomicrobia bacterium]|nr:VCBS repeat-containing protein [Verrucomicrobiota bacterium]
MKFEKDEKDEKTDGDENSPRRRVVTASDGSRLSGLRAKDALHAAAESLSFKSRVEHALGRSSRRRRVLNLDSAFLVSLSLVSSLASSNFNDDTFSDLLFQKADGSIQIWYMQGTNRTGIPNNDLRNPDPGSRLITADDLDLDRYPDVLFQHRGGLSVWHLQRQPNDTIRVVFNQNLVIEQDIAPPSIEAPAVQWHAVGTGDFNWDQKPDLALQHIDGTVQLCYLEGHVGRSLNLVKRVQLPTADLEPTQWRVVGVGNFRLGAPSDLQVQRSDGRLSDLLLQHSDGRLSVWRLGNTNVVVRALTNLVNANVVVHALTNLTRLAEPGLEGKPDPHFRAAVSDLNGDGYGDIVFRHSWDGTFMVSFNATNGFGAPQLLGPKTSEPGWRLAGPVQTPSISGIDTQFVWDDDPTPMLRFSVGDIDLPVHNLIVTGTSSNPNIVPSVEPGIPEPGNSKPGILVEGSGTNRTVQVTPIINQSGTLTITLTVTKTAVTNLALRAESKFDLVVMPTNDPPIITSVKTSDPNSTNVFRIPDQRIPKNTALGPIPFYVWDKETPDGGLTLEKSSTDQRLVPDDNIIIARSGTNRFLVVNPVYGAVGTSEVALSVTDGSNSTQMITFKLDVTGPNNEDFNGGGFPDLLFQHPDQTLGVRFMGETNQGPSDVLFTPNTLGLGWQVIGSGQFDSDDKPDLVLQHTNGTFQIGYLIGTNRLSFVGLSPPTDATDGWRGAGVADFDRDEKPDILLQHTNGNLRVWYPGPTNRVSPDLKSPGDKSWRVVGIGDFDRDGSADLLAQRSDGGLEAWRITTNTVEVLGSITNFPSNDSPSKDSKWKDPRWRPKVTDLDQDGMSDLVVRHSETGELEAWFMNGLSVVRAQPLDSFFDRDPGWRLAGPNYGPTITPIGAQIIVEGTINVVDVTVGDVETPPADLKVMVASSNQKLLPNNNINIVTKLASKGIIQLISRPNAPSPGEETNTLVTVSVRDSQQLWGETSFLLAVIPTNDPPAIQGLPNEPIRLPENTPFFTFRFEATDPETPQDLIVTATTSNADLANVSIGGSPTDPILLVLPRPNRSGKTQITIVADDRHGLSVSNTVNLAVIHIKGDINRDGRSDLFFQNADGSLRVWFMNETNRISGADITQGPPDPAWLATTWRAIDVEDFDGDGDPDILFQRQDGRLAVRKMKGTNFGDPMYFSPFKPEQGALAVGAGDFNNDLTADLLLQHPDGTLEVWYLTNRTIQVSSARLRPEGLDTSQWRVVGVSDFDRDGDPDLLLQHSNGSLAVWRLTDFALDSGEFLAPLSADDQGLLTRAAEGRSARRFDERFRASVADLNGDGNPGIVFRHSVDGRLVAWMMGTANDIVRYVNPGNAGPGLRIIGPNRIPSISPLSDQIINEDTNLVVKFSVGDVETPLTNLGVTAVSSNPQLVPNAKENMVLEGGGEERSLTIKPALDVNGEATIRVAVSDGFLEGVSNFPLRVNPVPDPPIVQFNEPSDSEEFLVRDLVPITVTASDSRDENGIITNLVIRTGSEVLADTRMNLPNFRTNITWIAREAGLQTLTATVVDRDGLTSTTNIQIKVLEPKPVFRLSASAYSGSEQASNAVVTILKNFSVAGAVDILALGRSAVPEKDGVGDYEELGRTLPFGSGETSQSVTIRLNRDGRIEGDEFFLISLGGRGGSEIASPSSATVTILDEPPDGNWPICATATNQSRPSFLVSGSLGTLIVNIRPNAAGGQWRFARERIWRRPGAVDGIAAGKHAIEFKPVNGFIQPADKLITLAKGDLKPVEADYIPTQRERVGSLVVLIQPDKDGLLGGQWRLKGDKWYRGGETNANVRIGSHVVEFDLVEGWTRPEDIDVTIVEGGLKIVAASYEQEKKPTVVVGTTQVTWARVNELPADALTPFRFNGLVRSEFGFGSGCVVKPHVVLTAAHVLFDRTNLVQATNITWMFQKYVGDHEPSPLLARGSYVFVDYADRRRKDAVLPGVAVKSFSLDAAALYFSEPAGRDGSAGYLVSDNWKGEWLSGGRNVTLVGYPSFTESRGDQAWGKMHQTVPSEIGLVLYDPSVPGVFATDRLKGFPGSSGSSLFVQLNNNFYPGAIYLGQTTEAPPRALFRAIDCSVVALIERAERSAPDGKPYNDGGIVQKSSDAQAPPNVGFLSVRISPQAALASGAGWRIVNTNAPVLYITNNAVELDLFPEAYTLEFKPVADFTLLTNREETVSRGMTNIVTVQYRPMPISLTATNREGVIFLLAAGPIDSQYTIQEADSLREAIAWRPHSTNVLQISPSEIFVRNTRNDRDSTRFYRAVLTKNERLGFPPP